MRAHRKLAIVRLCDKHSERMRSTIRAVLAAGGEMSTAEIAKETPWSVRTVGDKLRSMPDVVRKSTGPVHTWRLRRLPQMMR